MIRKLENRKRKTINDTNKLFTFKEKSEHTNHVRLLYKIKTQNGYNNKRNYLKYSSKRPNVRVNGRHNQIISSKNINFFSHYFIFSLPTNFKVIYCVFDVILYTFSCESFRNIKHFQTFRTRYSESSFDDSSNNKSTTKNG